ncbi:aldo/keto reductase [Sphingobium algorifonticola]|uniref:aldo/keto reductase n=1 Tax=Sphingobium algorifonticola TaxID=2008318 RepID=UPI001F49A19D|nr:aldo/keto reductase [Sphingobium algorifonticola]
MSSPLVNRLAQSGLALPALGFGAASIGNLYRPVSDAEAEATVLAALDAGMTYIDTAPYYGFGLSERRVGDVVRGRKDIVLSTKVGRLLRPDPSVGDDRERHGFCSPMPFAPHYDYSHDAIMRSVEDSFQRLGLARIDLLYIHDIGHRTHGAANGQHMDALVAGGGLRALEALREEGVISGFGIGVNELEACAEVMAHAQLDAILLAGRYTLLEQDALDDMLPACLAAGTAVVIGGPYNSGILATGTRQAGPVHYDYGVAPAHVVEKVARIEALCRDHDIPLAAAALQFPLAHPAVASVIPGLGSVARVQQTQALATQAIPGDFWAQLRAEGLVRPDAPLPGLPTPC